MGIQKHSPACNRRREAVKVYFDKWPGTCPVCLGRGISLYSPQSPVYCTNCVLLDICPRCSEKGVKEKNFCYKCFWHFELNFNPAWPGCNDGCADVDDRLDRPAPVFFIYYDGRSGRLLYDHEKNGSELL